MSDLLITLKRIANLAHAGGYANLTEADTPVEVNAIVMHPYHCPLDGVHNAELRGDS